MDDFELTAEDVASYEQLLDPESGSRSQTYKWNDDLSRNIVGMILGDRVFLQEAIDMVEAKFFDNKAHRAIVDVVLGHYREWSVIPNQGIIMEKLKTRYKDDEDRLFYAAELTLCRDAFVPGLDSRDYAITLIETFAKKKAMMEAMQKVLEEIKRGSPDSDATFDRINSHIDKARSVGRKFTGVGLNYFEELESRFDIMGQDREQLEVFTTGFKHIDDNLTDGGLRRGKCGSFIALPGVGKSLALTKASVLNVLNGKRVIYLSTEMDENSIAQRFDAQFAKHDIRRVIQDRHIVIPAIRSVVEDFDDRRRLIIKQFAPKTANMDTFRAFFAQLALLGWRPDMAILDYVGECKDYPEMKTYESRERLVSEFRGMGVELQFACLTAMQPNRTARDAQKESIIDDSNLGDAFGQTRPLDAFWSINQRDDEKKMNVARIFCIKHREGKSRFLFYVQFDEQTLEFREISENAYRAKMQGFKDDVVNDVKIDEYRPEMPPAPPGAAADDEFEHKSRRLEEKRGRRPRFPDEEPK